MSYRVPADRMDAAHPCPGATGMQTAAVAFSDAVFTSEDAATPTKFRELIAIEVGATTQSTSCIDTHTQASAKAGASPEEVAEAATVAAGIPTGGVTHGFWR